MLHQYQPQHAWRPLGIGGRPASVLVALCLLVAGVSWLALGADHAYGDPPGQGCDVHGPWRSGRATSAMHRRRTQYF
jgi:hypothetical protein